MPKRKYATVRLKAAVRFPLKKSTREISARLGRIIAASDDLLFDGITLDDSDMADICLAFEDLIAAVRRAKASAH
jgi:hypothetical protein